MLSANARANRPTRAFSAARRDVDRWQQSSCPPCILARGTSSTSTATTCCPSSSTRQTSGRARRLSTGPMTAASQPSTLQQVQVMFLRQDLQGLEVWQRPFHKLRAREQSRRFAPSSTLCWERPTVQFTAVVVATAVRNGYCKLNQI